MIENYLTTCPLPALHKVAFRGSLPSEVAPTYSSGLVLVFFHAHAPPPRSSPIDLASFSLSITSSLLEWPFCSLFIPISAFPHGLRRAIRTNNGLHVLCSLDSTICYLGAAWMTKKSFASRRRQALAKSQNLEQGHQVNPQSRFFLVYATLHVCLTFQNKKESENKQNSDIHLI